MKRASVSEAKNGLSALLDDIRRGETVLITHHGAPVARMEPYDASWLAQDEVAEALVHRQVADPPRSVLDVKRFLAAPAPRLLEGFSASRVVAAERDESR
jgi:prevent-host-death family protein